MGLAALAAGLVNALAGGGTLITFPVLMAVGLPAVAANVTNTVALCPGYLGATFAQFKDLQGQKKRLWLLLPAAVIGGGIGGILLLNTGEKVFRSLVPFLILLASGLLASQDVLRGWLTRRTGQAGAATSLDVWAWLPIGLAAIYGGYFGAGLSVIVLATLGLLITDSLTRLNALKQIISFSVNITAALFFVFSGQVVWSVALVMAVGALIGGALGGRLASRIRPALLRWTVVTIGTILGLIYLLR
ncbi:MAG: sulfite exporter TauE/SafE family protein [Anaerolineae bacterium]|nr:sulfite exporter TauE/SafE family protein [Anaerolineae bacterium]